MRNKYEIIYYCRDKYWRDKTNAKIEIDIPIIMYRKKY